MPIHRFAAGVAIDYCRESPCLLLKGGTGTMFDQSDKSNPDEEQFELLGLLGIGGFAHTHKARVLDRELLEDFGAEIVALKIPHNDKKRALKRDLEMNTLLHLRLRDLHCENIVRYLGFSIFRGQIVLAFEYVAQGSLRKLLGPLGRQQRLPVEQAVKIAAGILKGLSVIHNEQVFHRDIKPENILMQGQIAKIADLGLSRMLSPQQAASSATGTPLYMSPETLLRGGASFVSDIWSLGVTLYEMITGTLPIGEVETAFGELVDLMRKQEIVPPNEICPDIPRSLCDVVMRALRADPAERYATADEMLIALQGILEEKDSRIEKDMAPIRELIDAGGNPNQIEGMLQALVKQYAGDARAYQYLGEYYNRCQRYCEAIEVFKKGLELDAESALLNWDKALACQASGNRRDALNALRKAQSLGLPPNLQRHASILLKVLGGGKK